MKASLFILSAILSGCHSLYHLAPEYALTAGPGDNNPVSVYFTGAGGILGNSRFYLPDSLLRPPDPSSYYEEDVRLKFRIQLPDGRQTDIESGSIKDKTDRVINLSRYTSDKIRIILSVAGRYGSHDLQYATVYRAKNK